MISCFVIDDEPLAIKLLSDYVSKSEYLELKGSFTDPIKAMHEFEDAPVDLIFLDVQMPQLTGIQFMQIMGNKTHFILTTAYDNYALESYEFDVVDYLLKPITLGRFITAVNKAKERIQGKENKSESSKIIIEKKENKSFIFVKTEYKVKKINLSDIQYFEGLGDYVSIQLGNQKILTLENMKSFESRLPESHFMRVHRSFIIPFSKIDFIEKNRIVIQGKYIPVGKTYQDVFWSRINKN